MTEKPAGDLEVDAVVIGAGFAGMAMVNRLRENGFAIQGFEIADDVGGTWYWNRYPGARCDVESMQYSYRFSEDLQQEWEWSEHYAAQPEILRYANHVADRFDLRKHFRFNTRVAKAMFDEGAKRWLVEASDGTKTRARFLISALGCLSTTNTPDIAGLNDFAGELVHTGRWPKEGVDVAGKRVGVIGTGSSGVQAIPMLAKDAAELFVFQRTASYAVPARNRPNDPARVQEIKNDYKGFRDLCGRNFGAMAPGARKPKRALSVDDAARREIYEHCWREGGFAFQGAFADLTTSAEAGETARDFFRYKIAEIVSDPATAEKLTPKHRFGIKRLCIGTDYFETYNRQNVHLVDLKATPIVCVTREGVRTSDATYPLDVLVLATGYDALTGPLLNIDITGRGDLKLKDKWADGAHSYLGVGVAGFPNLFIITGPGSPSVLTNVIYAIEQNVDWISDCLVYLRRAGVETMEAEIGAEEAWAARVNELAAHSVMRDGESWYTGANIAGKPRNFMIYLDYPDYVARCDAIAAEGYRGFALTTAQ